MQQVKTPTPGRIVNYFPKADDSLARANGATVIPAIITQVWGKGADPATGPCVVNIRAFPDSEDVLCRQSVAHESMKLDDNDYWAYPVIEPTNQPTNQGSDDLDVVLGLTRERKLHILEGVAGAMKRVKSNKEMASEIDNMVTTEAEARFAYNCFGVEKVIKVSGVIDKLMPSSRSNSRTPADMILEQLLKM